jgi:PAS domain S-box-containing protein
LQEIILSGLRAGLFVCDAEKRGFPIVQITPEFTAITGYSAEKVRGEKLALLYGARTDANDVKSINRTLNRKQTFHGELLCYQADGKPVWCDLIIEPRAARNDSPAYFAAALFDISERKKREGELREQEANCRRIFENAVEGIYQSAPDGHYLQVNMALARMYGYHSPEALMKKISDIQNQIYVDSSMREQFKNLIQNTDQVRGLEYQVRRRDGRIIWISENARVVRDANGRARYYEGFIEEITQRKEAEAALQLSQQRLIETSRQVTLAEMASGILHNIGNALNSVNISASVAADKVKNSKIDNVSKAITMLRDHENDLADFLKNDSKGRHLIGYLGDVAQHLLQEQTALQEELKVLKKSVEHANEIIASQQNYAKTSGRFETVKAVDLVEDALRMNVNSLARHQVEVVRDYASQLPEVTVQKHQVLQILVNLIRNAQKACEAFESSDKRLILRVRADSQKKLMRIEVHDSGIGIPPENLSQIFTHGFTTREDGHGFGLHSGARMAKELGGSLTGQSEGVGKGASFILEFPCQPPAQKTKEKR